LEDDVRFEYVIRVDQDQTAVQSREQARAEARAEAAEARARAQENAQRIRDEAQRIRDRVQEQVRTEIQREMQGGHGPGGVIVVPPTPPPWQHGIPPQVVDIFTLLVVGLVICIVGLPIARALGRWIDRRGSPSPINAELAAQMNRIEQAVDSMSIEVERISEAQRFQAKLLSDRESARA
jgi:hypothetical protein